MMVDQAAIKESMDRLHKAIEDCMAAHGYMHDDPDIPMVITEWVVLVGQRGFDKHGESHSGLANLVGPDPDVPWSHLLGVLRAAQLRLERTYLSDD